MGEWLFITFALTGRSSGFYVTQGVALGSGLVGLSARAWPLTIGLWTCWAFSPCPESPPPLFSTIKRYDKQL